MENLRNLYTTSENIHNTNWCVQIFMPIHVICVILFLMFWTQKLQKSKLLSTFSNPEVPCYSYGNEKEIYKFYLFNQIVLLFQTLIMD